MIQYLKEENKKQSDSLTKQDNSARNERLAKLQRIRESLDRSVDESVLPTQAAGAARKFTIPRVATSSNSVTPASSTPANTPRMANHKIIEGISPNDTPRAGPSSVNVNMKALTLCKRVPCTRNDCYFIHPTQEEAERAAAAMAAAGRQTSQTSAYNRGQNSNRGGSKNQDSNPADLVSGMMSGIVNGMMAGLKK